MPSMDNRLRTQTETVLAVLQMGDKLTQLEALRRFGIMRLASRISDLKRRGWPIKKMMIDVPGGAKVAEYWLPKGAERMGV